jgi:hypothetical protein
MTIDGTYELNVQTPLGVLNSKLTLKTDGNTLSGTSESSAGTTEFSGSIDGDEVDWKDRPNTPLGPMDVTFRGKVEGDTISGKAETSVGSFPFECTRV